ncbi:STAS domain-containing protein [Cellulomonas xylanilytica]|uniref:STAS domain-containing protein n=1 Tax=Cellulomonas xylanilytica TaxID=233583 RepID=A0A510V9S9_9CELL|nr:STAS domain-containing protein [Cellulomonas xylanilytica]GEK23506.1 hypothetical protein CXY01_40260 [Cellulomonas xylanilytica]
MSQGALGQVTPPDDGPAGTITTDLDAGEITLRGEIDAALEAALVTVLSDVAARRAAPQLRVDVREVSFIDSTGIKFLALLTQRSAHPVVLLHPSSQVRFVLDTTRISEILTIVD